MAVGVEEMKGCEDAGRELAPSLAHVAQMISFVADAWPGWCVWVFRSLLIFLRGLLSVIHYTLQVIE